MNEAFQKKNKVEKFFLKEGDSILSFALRALSVQPLKFLEAEDSIVPREVLKKVLRKNDFSALRMFLHGQAGLESIEKPSLESRELQIEKFKILLSIDNEGVKNFMQKNIDDEYLQTETIKQNFVEAERRFKAENSASNTLAPPSC